MNRMNEREEFLRNFRPVFIKLVERLETMTESQILDGHLEVRAARDVYKAEIAQRIGKMIPAGSRELPQIARRAYTREEIAYLVSVQAFLNSLNRLRSRAGAKATPLGGFSFFGLLEDALNERLEVLTKKPSSDS